MSERFNWRDVYRALGNDGKGSAKSDQTPLAPDGEDTKCRRCGAFFAMNGPLHVCDGDR